MEPVVEAREVWPPRDRRASLPTYVSSSRSRPRSGGTWLRSRCPLVVLGAGRGRLPGIDSARLDAHHVGDGQPGRGRGHLHIRGQAGCSRQRLERPARLRHVDVGHDRSRGAVRIERRTELPSTLNLFLASASPVTSPTKVFGAPPGRNASETSRPLRVMVSGLREPVRGKQTCTRTSPPVTRSA